MLDRGADVAGGKRANPFLLSDEIKRLAAPLILSTTYPLNRSATKKLVIGLQPQMDGHFEPSIKLINKEETAGIALNCDTWADVTDHVGGIMEYYDSTGFSAIRQRDPVQLGEYKIVYTTSYGKKAIAFDHCRKQPESVAVLMDCEPENQKKFYHPPPLLLQKSTFEGLIQLIVCVDERLHRLHRYSADVDKCFDSIVANLRVKLPDEPMEDLTIPKVQNLLKKHEKDLKNSAQNSGMSLVFLEHFFNITYAELTVLCVPLIINEMKKKKIAKRNPVLPPQYGAWR